ncbi:MAG: MoaD/ThiS family protein [Actinobacteria bacterium]|nr:MoaD/ThiS family protein [Actinomycetota bacterium]
MATVRIPPPLRSETAGEPEIAASGETVRGVLGDVAARFPALGRQVMSEGEVARFVNVYVGGEDIRTLSGLDTPVEEGTTIILLPAVAGGLD